MTGKVIRKKKSAERFPLHLNLKYTNTAIEVKSLPACRLFHLTKQNDAILQEIVLPDSTQNIVKLKLGSREKFTIDDVECEVTCEEYINRFASASRSNFFLLLNILRDKKGQRRCS
jgi:hypothetical protein